MTAAEKSFPGLKQLLKLPKAIGIGSRLTQEHRCNDAVGRVSSTWRSRIDDVKSCPDNRRIERVDGAGQFIGPYIRMHNGTLVASRGYYGDGILNMLIENQGVHEPQEELAFSVIIEQLPPRPVMLELGAYWGFYSLSLLQQHNDAICHLVEPCPVRIESGKLNFRANNRNGKFVRACVDASDSWSWMHGRTVSVDGYCKSNAIDHLHILHADIQGFEFKMLRGSQHMLRDRKIDYIFISTHSNPLHQQCFQELQKYNYDILASADKDETYSFDGLIVAKRSEIEFVQPLEISRKRAV